MIEIKTYTCGICGKEYTDKTRWKLCENYHRKPVEIVRAIHDIGIGGKYSGFPYRIDIKMNDGSVMEYEPCREE